MRHVQRCWEEAASACGPSLSGRASRPITPYRAAAIASHPLVQREREINVEVAKGLPERKLARTEVKAAMLVVAPGTPPSACGAHPSYPLQSSGEERERHVRRQQRQDDQIPRPSEGLDDGVLLQPKLSEDACAGMEGERMRRARAFAPDTGRIRGVLAVPATNQRKKMMMTKKLNVRMLPSVLIVFCKNVSSSGTALSSCAGCWARNAARSLSSFAFTA